MWELQNEQLWSKVCRESVRNETGACRSWKVTSDCVSELAVQPITDPLFSAPVWSLHPALPHGASYLILKETLPDGCCDQCQKMLRFECAPQSSDVRSFIPSAVRVGRRSLTRDYIMRAVPLSQGSICYEKLIRFFLPFSLEFSCPSTTGWHNISSLTRGDTLELHFSAPKL